MNIDEIKKQCFEIDDSTTEVEHLHYVENLLYLLIDKLEFNEPINEQEEKELEQLKQCHTIIRNIIDRL